MKLKVEIGALTDLVAQSTATIDHKLDSLSSNVFLRAAKRGESSYLYAFATDMVSRTLGKVKAEVETAGEVTVSPGKLLAGLANRPREEMAELSLLDRKDNVKLQVKYKSNHFVVPTIADIEWFSKQVETMPLKGGVSLTMPGNSLAEFCRRGLFCVPTDSLAPTGVQKGMNLTDHGDQGYEAQASDGAIAVRIRVQADKGKDKLGSLLLPYRALSPLSRLLAKRGEEEVHIVQGSKGTDGQSSEVFFRFGDALYGSRLLAGKFPNLEHVFAGTKSDYRFDVEREELYGALGRASSFLPQSHTVNLELKGEILEINSAGSMGETIEERLPVEPVGEASTSPVKIKINLDYLFNIANGSRSQKLNLGMSGPDRAMEIQDTEDKSVNSQYILMGIK